MNISVLFFFSIESKTVSIFKTFVYYMYSIFIMQLLELYFRSLNYEYNVCYRDKKNMSKPYVMLAVEKSYK